MVKMSAKASESLVDKKLYYSSCFIPGAAIHASVIFGNGTGLVKDFKLTDVTPLSLGTDVWGGLMSIIIPRNSKIPAKATEEYSTVRANQTAARIDILEGERIMACDNNKLGELIFYGITPMPRKMARIDVTFQVDDNGLLTVAVVEHLTEKSIQSIISYDTKRLSKHEMKRMIESAEKFREEDNVRKEAAKARNDLEDYCFDVQDQMLVESESRTEKSRETILKKCGENITWIDAGGSHEKYEYQMRKMDLKFMLNALK